MNRLLEIFLGLDSGFLSREGELSLRFHPSWPWSEVFGAAAWNLLLIALAIGLVVWVYRREGKSRRWRIGLAVARVALLLVLIALLNRPTLSLTRARIEPSVLAVLVDDSGSMRVRDVETGSGPPAERLSAVRERLFAESAELLRSLSEAHELRFYRFNRDASTLGLLPNDSVTFPESADGPATAIASSVQSVLAELQGQNLAGLVLFTDGKDSPARPAGEEERLLKQAGVKLFPVAVGGEGEPRNVEVQSIAAQDVAFAGDIVNIVATIRAVGFEGERPITVELKDQDGNVILDPDGNPVTATQEVTAGVPTEIELPLETIEPGMLNLVVEAQPQPNEIDPDDNRRPLQIEVMDARIAVLYVDGYPRWEYRYLKNQLIRDSTVEASILLTSADPTFAQEGNRPIQRFPVTLDELLNYDVVVIGDVSPQQFSDGQLQLLEEFVGEAGGGFGMIAGPRSSPWLWAGTPVERLLPVEVVAEPSLGVGSSISEGFRPQLTDAGRRSGIFRFRPTREENAEFLADQIQPLFWWADGIIAKPGVGEVLAQHPEASGPDGRPAPLVVTGRYGAGRTLFNGIDESWRWRYYTGEPVFDTFWVQQMRFLARGRKLGQRRLAFAVERPAYELGEQVQAELRVLDPGLADELPDRLTAELRNEEGQLVQSVQLVKRESDTDSDRYTVSLPAERVGIFSLVLPAIAGATEENNPLRAGFAVKVPQLELDRPIVDRAALRRLAQDTGGMYSELSEAGRLPELIQSAERRIPVVSERSLWDAPLALALITLLLITEWVGRKIAGLI